MHTQQSALVNGIAMYVLVPTTKELPLTHRLRVTLRRCHRPASPDRRCPRGGVLGCRDPALGPITPTHADVIIADACGGGGVANQILTNIDL
jgi:hypothetical protein